ncbi:MAG: ATP-binding protein [Candidatus Heimdallarchaeota archaeon]|nr:ATP-binding protein [Candidatus Heimdallarchaeota archaeon]
MDPVEEISYLSEKGYDFLEQGNFIAAKTYFMDAYTIVQKLNERSDSTQQIKLEEVATSLITLAQEAHSLNFKNDTNLFPEAQQIKQKRGNGKKQRRKRGKALKIYLAASLEKEREIIWKPTDLMNGITTITGGSGSGKTQTIRRIVSELTENKIPTIVFDLHGDIELPIKTISLDYIGKQSINPLELSSKSRKDGGPIPHINRLMTQFSYAIPDRFSATQQSWLRGLLRFSYYVHGIIQDDPDTWYKEPPTFSYLLDLLKYPEEKIGPTKNREYLRLLDSITMSTRIAVENRMISILEHPAFSGKNNINLENLLTEPHRIVLKPLNTIDLQFLAADTIMRQIFAYLVSKGHIQADEEDNKFRLFIVIDEVKILTGYRGNINDPYHILNRFATEARKFGLGLILASQVLGHFGRDIRSNSATKLILKTMDLDEARRCAKELKIDLKKLNAIKRPGEGFIITSKNKQAEHIQIYNYETPEEEVIDAYQKKEQEEEMIKFVLSNTREFSEKIK